MHIIFCPCHVMSYHVKSNTSPGEMLTCVRWYGSISKEAEALVSRGLCNKLDTLKQILISNQLPPT